MYVININSLQPYEVGTIIFISILLKKKYWNKERLNDLSKVIQLGSVTFPASVENQESWVQGGTT